MDRNSAPAEAGASRPAAADVPPAAGPETRRRHRNGPGLLGTRPTAGSLPDGPATIPAQPVRTGRPDRGGMDSGVHRRRRPPAGRAGRTDAGISQGAHRHWDDRTAGHRGPSGPPRVHNGPGRPPGARRHGTRKPGATAVRLRPRRLAVGPGPYQPSGPEQPGTTPATPPSGRRMAKAPGHRRQLSIPALPQAGGAAGTQPRGRDAGHPAGRLVPALPAPAPRRPEPPAPRRGRVEKSGERTPPGLQPRGVPVEFPGPGRLGVSAHHRQPQAQATCRVTG